MTSIWNWVKEQKRGVLPSEVHAAFPDKTAKQISDCLTDYVSRRRMRRVTITSGAPTLKPTVKRVQVLNSKFSITFTQIEGDGK